MHRYYLQLLVALVSCVSLAQKAWCETTVDEEPSTPPEKGKFYQTHVFGERPRGCSVVYSADASAMSSTWKSSDFRLLNDVYTTGAYFENKIYSAESPTIYIPTITYSDRLFVCLEEMFEVESSYDYVWIDVTTDGGNVWSRIYGKSGYTEGMVIDYLDVSFLSGKDAIFKISLKSDSSFTGAGWDIKKFEVLSHVRNAQNEERKSQLRSGDVEPIKNPDPVNPGAEGGQSGSEGGQSGTEGNPEIIVDKLKILNVQWESENEGVISFSAMKKVNENGEDKYKFITSDEISINDIVVIITDDNNKEVARLGGDCLSFDEMEGEKRPVDITLVVDYSSSMSSYIKDLRNSLVEMLKLIEEVYDIRFSLLRFGLDYDPQNISSNIKNADRLYANNSINYYDKGFFWTVDEEGDYFYSYNELLKNFDLCVSGGNERAYNAMMHALSLPKYRQNASKVMILLLDYDGTLPSETESGYITKNDMGNALIGTQLFAITNKSSDDHYTVDTVRYHNSGVYIKNKNSIFVKYFNEDWFKSLCDESGGYFSNLAFSEVVVDCNDNSHYVERPKIEDLSDNQFSQISNYIGDNLLNRFFLRINPNCIKEKLNCGNKYNVSVSISSSISDDINSTYIYSGGIERDQSTAEYDNTCIDSDKLKVKFTISGGCGDDLYGDVLVYYRYSDPTQKEYSVKANLISPKDENNTYVYEASVPVDFASSYIKYRIEVEHNKENTATKGLSNLIYPIPSEESDGYWTVKICDPCNNIQLSSHILEEDNDLLSFDVYRENTNVEIFLCDTLGKKITSKKVDDVNVGNKEINLISFLSLNDLIIDGKKIKLSYTRPYILALKINEKVSYMYVYLGRKKKQN